MESIAPRFLQTPRLELHALREGDGDWLCALYRSNRDRFADSFPTAVSQLVDRESGERYVAAKLLDRSSRKGYWYGLWDRGGAKFIGQIQVKNINWEVGLAELAYLIDREAEGRGLATEAMREMIRMCFEDLRLAKLFLRTIVGNDRSESLARRFGFTCEGLLRQEFLTLDGRRVDLRYFGLLSSDKR